MQMIQIVKWKGKSQKVLKTCRAALSFKPHPMFSWCSIMWLPMIFAFQLTIHVVNPGLQYACRAWQEMDAEWGQSWLSIWELVKEALCWNCFAWIPGGLIDVNLFANRRIIRCSCLACSPLQTNCSQTMTMHGALEELETPTNNLI